MFDSCVQCLLENVCLCMLIIVLLPLYLCVISTLIFISLLPYSELQLTEDFMLYNYTPNESSVPTA